MTKTKYLQLTSKEGRSELRLNGQLQPTVTRVVLDVLGDRLPRATVYQVFPSGAVEADAVVQELVSIVGRGTPGPVPLRPPKLLPHLLSDWSDAAEQVFCLQTVTLADGRTAHHLMFVMPLDEDADGAT